MFPRLSFVRLARALLSSPIGMASEEVGHTLRGVYVLLVDDNPRHRDVLREILQYCGAWVREAVSAQEAVSLLRETTPTALVVAESETAAESLTLVFSWLAWVSDISPSLTARCSRSQEASCISRVVSRMLSVA